MPGKNVLRLLPSRADSTRMSSHPLARANQSLDAEIRGVFAAVNGNFVRTVHKESE